MQGNDKKTTKKPAKIGANAEPPKVEAPKPVAQVEPRKTEPARNVVFVGEKPVKLYTMVAFDVAGRSMPKVVVLKARGKNVARAIAVANIMREQMLADLKGIEIGCDTFIGDDGRPRKTASIAISVGF